jgi:uncharacterized damage-inducible protein DinB
MQDEAFINSILQKGNEAKEKVSREFTNLSPEQLNWKPSPERWSIAQCLEHLIRSHKSYLSDFEKITEGKYVMNLWERYSPLTAIWGRLMKDQLQEHVKRKMKAPGKIRPSMSELGIIIITDYYKSLDGFLEYITRCKNIDLDKTVITSPILQIVTYSLRDTLQFLVQHEHRHINQALRVKSNENFPVAPVK